MEPGGNLFEVICRLGKRVRTTKRYWERIVTVKHPSMQNRQEDVKAALEEPDEIRVSLRDDMVHLYYKRFGPAYICVVARHEDGTGFIITTYPTENVKLGRQVWRR